MNSPKVSVLMVVYNADKYLRSAIDSVLNQSFHDFELIIIDDGSSDRGREIIESIQDSRIRTVWNPVKHGVAYVRNQGLRMARGKYIAVLDADDIAYPERLRVQSDFLDSKPGVCLVGSSFEIIDRSGQVVGLVDPPNDPLTIRWKLLFGNVIGHSMVMYRLKEVMAAGGYDQAFSFAEDYDLWVRLVARGQLMLLPEPVGRYRVHSGNTTQATADSAKEQSVLNIVARGIGQLTQSTIDSNVLRTLCCSLYEPAANAATLVAACRTIEDCLNCVLRSETLTRSERKQLVSLALEDLARIALKNPDSGKTTRSAAFRCMVRHDPIRLLQRPGMVLALRSVLPGPIVRLLKRT